MHELGGRLLEQLLNADGRGYGGARIPCGQGHQAAFVEYRGKEVLTVLAPVQVQRAYYHCGPCAGGVVPKDQALDIVGTSFSPGVRRLMSRLGGKEAFAEGRRDLAELAGIVVTTKAVERVAEAIGAEIETLAPQEQALALAGKLLPLQAVGTLYLAIDGTGVPVVPHETAGRPGKGEAGQATTREVKLGCVFTQTRLDAKGRPLRDEGSTTYVGAIESAEAFGRRLYAEAVRRGVALGRLRPRGEEAQEAVRKAQGYFETNAARMRYARFRRQGLFVGSGVVEAGCKTIVGLRLKQSGMRWTVRGANAILALRCADLSGRWEEFWEARAAS
jgi:hypothetical protein